MEEVHAYSYNDYRAYLKAAIAARKESWGLVTRLAQAASCQRPYLSKVLKGEAQLTPAQAYGIAKFLKLSADATEYFLLLLELERAGTKEYREHVEQKLRRSKREHEDISRRVNREMRTLDMGELSYYSSWQWSAVHILVSIPEYRTVDKIASRLELPKELVKSILYQLEQRNRVVQKGSEWFFAGQEEHISKNSPLVSLHHGNWRARAILDSQMPARDSLHYTAIQSVSRSDYQRIKDLFLELIEKSSQIAGPSKEEELVCMMCDVFKP